MRRGDALAISLFLTIRPQSRRFKRKRFRRRPARETTMLKTSVRRLSAIRTVGHKGVSHRAEHHPGRTTHVSEVSAFSFHKTVFSSLSGSLCLPKIAVVSLLLFSQRIDSVDVFNCAIRRFAAELAFDALNKRQTPNGGSLLTIGFSIIAVGVRSLLMLLHSWWR